MPAHRVGAGIALHATVPGYHCSGAWNAPGCAAVAARLLALDAAQIRKDAGPFWSDLGTRWRIREQYLGPVPAKSGRTAKPPRAAVRWRRRSDQA
jgi:2-methylcitrate dehydratase PrpD